MEFDKPRLDALRAAVDAGTFEAAARVLVVTPSAISQRIKSLESETGRVLLQRSKPIRPTESGEVLLRLARQVDALSRDADAALGRPGASGARSRADGDGDASAETGTDGLEDARLEPLPIAVNADSLATWLLPALEPLAGRIAFELHRADESRTAELLRQGAVTAAITADPKPVQGCSSVLLGAMRYRPMASPPFVERWFSGEESRQRSLAHAPVVVFDREDALQHRYLRSMGVDPDGPPCHYVPSSEGFVDAVRRGFGWGLVPELQAEGQGTPLLALDEESHVDVPLYWQQWALHTAPLSRTAAVVQQAATRALRRPA